MAPPQQTLEPSPCIASPPLPMERRSRIGKRLAVVAPAYNEASVLPLFFARIEAVLARCGVEWEIVCVNDGSSDATLAVLLRERQRNPAIKIVDLSRNFGKEIALSAGLDAATGDVVVPIDVDLQDPPELILDFLDRWEDGYDVVYGLRRSRDKDTVLKRMTAFGFYSAFQAVSEVPMPPNAGDFRLMDRSVVEVLKTLPERNRFMKGLFAWVGFRQCGVAYDRPARAAGQSAWRYWRLWNFALDGFTSFSTTPLRIWTYIGGATAFGAFAYAFFLIARTLLNGTDVPGYASLMVVILMGTGLQMLAMGVFGEYLGRVFQEVKGRPLYVARRTYGLDGPT